MKDMIIVIIVVAVVAYFFVPSFQSIAEPYVDQAKYKVGDVLSANNISDIQITDNNSIFSVLGLPGEGGDIFNCRYNRDCREYFDVCLVDDCVCLDDGNCAKKLV